MKVKNVLITTVISLITLALGFVGGVKAEESSFVSKGRIQSGGVIYDANDFSSVYEQIKDIQKEAYDLGNQSGEVLSKDVSFSGTRNIADLIPAETSFLGAGIVSSGWGYNCWDNGVFGFNSYLSYDDTAISVSGATCTVRIWYSDNGSSQSTSLPEVDLTYNSFGKISDTRVIVDTSDFNVIQDVTKEVQAQAYEKGKTASLKYVDVSGINWGTKNISSYLPEGAILVGAGCTYLHIDYYSYDNGGVSIYGNFGYNTSNNDVSIGGSATLPFAGAPNNRVCGGSGNVRIFYKE